MILYTTKYEFSQIIADTLNYVIRKKAITFKNTGNTDVYINGVKAIIPGDSISLGGLENKNVDDVFDITFFGGVGELLVIEEIEQKIIQ